MIARRTTLAGAVAAPALLIAGRAAAQEVTLRAVSVFQEGTVFSKPFEAFIAKVNAEGRGLVRINFIGGPRAMPPFEVGNALRNGVVDLINASGAFYDNLMPEANALKMLTIPWADVRKKPGWSLIEQLHNEKVNAHYLARHGSEVPFHLYTTRKIVGPDLRGVTIRTTPTYRAFFAALGANLVNTPPGEVYTALERGVVAGYGWPAIGIFDLGWQERTKFRIDPAFYRVEVSLLLNNRRWQAMRPEQQAFLTQMSQWSEENDVRETREAIAADYARMAAVGIKPIEFTGEARERWLQVAADAGWAEIQGVAPQHTPALRKLLTEA